MIRGLLALSVLLGSLYAAHVVAAGTPAGPDSPPLPSHPERERININTASPAKLAELPGIGPGRAQAIVEERERRRFRRVEDILRVPGIGRKTFARIRDSICVE